MMRRWILIAILLALALALVACEGTSGSSSGARKSCRANPGSSHCEGSIKKMNGTISVALTASRSPGDAEVTVSAMAESGTVRVYLVNSNNATTEALLKPGAPVTFSGLGEVVYDSDGSYINLYFEASDAPATGISYTADVTYP